MSPELLRIRQTLQDALLILTTDDSGLLDRGTQSAIAYVLQRETKHFTDFEPVIEWLWENGPQRAAELLSSVAVPLNHVLLALRSDELSVGQRADRVWEGAVAAFRAAGDMPAAVRMQYPHDPFGPPPEAIGRMASDWIEDGSWTYGALTIMEAQWQDWSSADQSSRAALVALKDSEDQRRELSGLVARGGDSVLSAEFRELAGREGRAAIAWTWAAIATTGAGIAIGWGLHSSSTFGGELASVLYPLVVGFAFAGLAAYFARLGGHRRHTAQWARSIRVQLDAYAKFVEHTTPEAAVAVFDRFSARVLGAPPPRNEKSSLPPMTVADVVSLVSKSS